LVIIDFKVGTILGNISGITNSNPCQLTDRVF